MECDPSSAMLRRTFLSASAVAAAASAPVASAATAARTDDGPLIDTNVTLGSWAVRRGWADSASALADKLARHGVSAAWCGSFEGVLHSDVAGANERLARACAQDGRGVLLPFGTVNPTLPDWEDDLRRCAAEHRMRGLRLHPNYHGYTLDDRRFLQLLAAAGERRLLVQIALSLEDDRSQNPVLTAAPVPAAPLADALAALPQAQVMLLNATSRVFGSANPLFQRLVAAGVHFEIATLEGVAGLESLLRAQPSARFLFGSHSPYFYFESALLKLEESALTATQRAAIRHGHASAALETRAPSAPASRP